MKREKLNTRIHFITRSLANVIANNRAAHSTTICPSGGLVVGYTMIKQPRPNQCRSLSMAALTTTFL